MSKKWLAREGERWVREEIVTPEQLARLKSLYEKEDRGAGLLPLFGGLLLGLGILSFVAANWQELPQLARLALLLATMLGFYGAGWRLLRKGSETLGVALVSVGLFAFGGGVVLVGQMFHLVAYNALSMIVWAAAGIALAYLLRSRYLFLVSLALIGVAQGYSISAFGEFSYAALALLAVGLGPFVRKDAKAYPTLLWSLAVVVHALLLFLAEEWTFGWYFAPLLLLYVAGDLAKPSAKTIALQAAPLAAAFVFGLAAALVAGFEPGHWAVEERPAPLVFVPAFVALLAVSAFFKRRRGEIASLVDWLPLLPLFYAPPGAIATLYLAALFVYSLAVLLQGYAYESRTRINAGIALFLVTTMSAYFKLTWAFMDKSMFFLIGGVLLLLLSWLLNRRKRIALVRGKEEE